MIDARNPLPCRLEMYMGKQEIKHILMDKSLKVLISRLLMIRFFIIKIVHECNFFKFYMTFGFNVQIKLVIEILWNFLICRRFLLIKANRTATVFRNYCAFGFGILFRFKRLNWAIISQNLMSKN